MDKDALLRDALTALEQVWDARFSGARKWSAVQTRYFLSNRPTPYIVEETLKALREALT